MPTILRLLLILLYCSAVVARADSRPNFVLFIADDVSWNDLGCYGNTAARTPRIDALAASGLRFNNAILTASSCSPSRASIITGRYPHNTGRASELHQPISAHLPWFPEILKAAGYYTALAGKDHMTSAAPKIGQSPRPPAFDLKDTSHRPGNRGGHASWVSLLRQRPMEKPFFCWFAAHDAHRPWEADNEWNVEQYGPKHSPANVKVPVFLADDSPTRRDLASYYNEVTRFDHYVGQVVDELQRQNVLHNTVILVMADNGRPFPRAKTRLHDSGMKTPLVIHWPAGITQHGECNALISAIDLAPTMLNLAGCEIPHTFQGRSLVPLMSDPQVTVRRYAFSEHNWHDYEAHGRSVRHNGWLLIRNYRPRLAWQGPADSVASPSHRALQQRQSQGLLSEAQQDVFQVPRPQVELYDLANDPDQLNNLANNPAFQNRRQELEAILKQWMDRTGDSVPDHLRPDAFDRHLGTRLRPPVNPASNVLAPGEDRNADRINHPGP